MHRRYDIVTKMIIKFGLNLICLMFKYIRKSNLITLEKKIHTILGPIMTNYELSLGPILNANWTNQGTPCVQLTRCLVSAM